MTDTEKALLGDHEAAKRLTEKGVLVPCCCGEDAHIKYDKEQGYKVCCGSLICGNETLWWGNKGTAIKIWNTRAAVEMEGMEDGKGNLRGLRESL